MNEAKIWKPFLAEDAKQDFAGIIRWTTRKFGRQQAAIYQELILQSLERLHRGPATTGARRRKDLDGLYTLNIARRGKPASHFLLYRPRDQDVIEVLRILHTSMDTVRHIPPEDPNVIDAGGE